jgi:hypothetical protein
VASPAANGSEASLDSNRALTGVAPKLEGIFEDASDERTLGR